MIRSGVKSYRDAVHVKKSAAQSLRQMNRGPKCDAWIAAKMAVSATASALGKNPLWHPDGGTV
jgi:hypothetical protein